MAGSAMVGRHAQICDRHQEIIRTDIGADLAGDGCSIKEHPRAGVAARSARAGRRRRNFQNAAPWQDHVWLQLTSRIAAASLPAPRRVRALQQGPAQRRACIHFPPEDGCDQVGALRKMPIDGADTDAGLFGDLSHGRVHSRVREDCFAAWSNASRLRCASARTRRSVPSRGSE